MTNIKEELYPDELALYDILSGFVDNVANNMLHNYIDIQDTAYKDTLCLLLRKYYEYSEKNKSKCLYLMSRNIDNKALNTNIWFDDVLNPHKDYKNVIIDILQNPPTQHYLSRSQY